MIETIKNKGINQLMEIEELSIILHKRIEKNSLQR